MGIQVRCPYGHSFKVKDKYAGKKGLCPHCDGQVVVKVPSLIDTQDKLSHGIEAAYRQAVSEEQTAPRKTTATATGDTDSSIFDDHPQSQDADTSGSLLGSSVMRHNARCEFCKESVPLWFAKCPSCGHYMESR